jgi:hypothetical protein
MVKRIEVKIQLPVDLFERLKAKFPEKEDFETQIVKLISEIVDAPLMETWHYRKIRGLVENLADAGKEITSENLAKYATEKGEVFSVSAARDWLVRMVQDKHIELVRREKAGKKIYRWIVKD